MTKPETRNASRLTALFTVLAILLWFAFCSCSQQAPRRRTHSHTSASPTPSPTIPTHAKVIDVPPTKKERKDGKSSK